MNQYYRSPRKVCRFLGWIVVFVLMLGGVFVPKPVLAAGSPLIAQLASAPTISDWLHRSFAQFPPINQSGSVDLSAYQLQLGYDASRRWQAGMTPNQYVKLGDISEALSPGSLTLNDIAARSNTDWRNQTLAMMPLVAEQTVAQLANAIPGLKKTPIKQIAPLARLLVSSAVAPIVQTAGIDPNTATVDQAIATPIADVKLSSLGTDVLSQIPLSSIPQIDQARLQGFDHWENAVIQSIPGLDQVPLEQFPASITASGETSARIDFVYGTHELDRHNTVSGSDVEGFHVPCQTNCAYIELGEPAGADNGAMTGKQWISGKYQSVKGGHGALAAINGGKEPTGRLPFGPVFKMVIMEPDESSDTVTTALFSRVCHGGLGCTPYFIGPIPFLTYARDSMIFVGTVDPTANTASVSDTSSSTPVSDSGGGGSTVVEPTPVQTCTQGTPAVAHSTNGVDLDALRTAIAGIESQGSGGYEAVGEYVCADGGQNCGRGLGKYQYMNYNPYAKNLIAAHPGGKAFLNRVAAGDSPSAAEIDQYFPPAEQNQAFNADLSQKIAETSRQIDPTTGALFTGDRLIARVAQKHYTGDYSSVDGGQDVRAYGNDAVQRYHRVGGQPTVPCDSASTATTPDTKGRIKGKSTNKYSYPIDPGQFVVPSGGEFGASRSFPVPHTHAGTDFAASMGTPFKAIDGGVVIFAGATDAGGFGSLIKIRHNNGSESWYGHPSAILVKPGDVVAPGQVIGRVGADGDSTGPHLHLELHTANSAVIDPLSQIHYVRD